MALVKMYRKRKSCRWRRNRDNFAAIHQSITRFLLIKLEYSRTYLGHLRFIVPLCRMSRNHRYPVPHCMECLLFRRGARKVNASVASVSPWGEFGQVMHERPCKPRVSGANLPIRERAPKVPWQYDPVNGHRRTMALH
jgi:hypothetical protein